MPRIARYAVPTVMILAIMGCAQRPVSETAQPAAVPLQKLESEHLPNLVRLHEKIISGGLPEGDAAFAELKSRGIKTIISVDGARPDVATAAKFGLRYVHLPHGYDGVPEETGAQLAKAARDLPGPIYIHCHHGKHRSPAAAAVACVKSGLLAETDAVRVLQLAGTSEHYQGLFDSVARAKRLEAAVLNNLPGDFPETAKLPAMAEAMVAIEHTHDHLKALEKVRWEKLADKPALEPPHEALLLREHFTELLRTEDVARRPARFQALLKEGEDAAMRLEQLLRDHEPEQASAALQAVTANCTACHHEYRDLPLRGKSASILSQCESNRHINFVRERNAVSSGRVKFPPLNRL